MKLLCICSALDISFRYGCTPAWWQYLKGFAEDGHEVIAVPYTGGAFETPWWRAYRNPCQLEGMAFSAYRKLAGRRAGGVESGFGGKVSAALIDGWIRPRWFEHIVRILREERNVDAVIVFNAPMNHFATIPMRLRDRFSVPFFYFDGDMPASLPKHGGFASGFRIYDGADLGEYDGVMCNSEGGEQELREMGAKRTETVHWGVDPGLYEPLELEEDIDVFFYGFGMEYRERLVDEMLVRPSVELTDRVFAVGGGGFGSNLGWVRSEGEVPFSAFRAKCCRSRINLNITRTTHANVAGSSTMRPFELAAMGRCVVSGPHAGIENWFEPGKEIELLDEPGKSGETYRRLLEGEEERRAMGRAARERVMRDHTHRHRTAQIARFLQAS